MPASVKPKKLTAEEKVQEKKFPLIMLSLAVILTAIVLISSLWSVYHFDVTTKEVVERYTAKQKTIDELKILRQRATLSIKRFIVNADPFWQQRYNKAVSGLKIYLNRAVKLAQKKETLQSARQLTAENDKLVEIERRAFSLVRQNEASRARELTNSQTYLNSLKNYNRNEQSYETGIEQVFSRRLAAFRQITFWVIIAGMAVFVISLITWAVVIRLIQNWSKALTRERKILRDSEAKFRSVFEQAALGIGRVRLSDAAWIDVNDAFCNMLGYNREDILNTPWPELTYSEDIDEDLFLFQRMTAGDLDSYSVEKRFIHKQGHTVWARLTLSLVRDENGNPDYEVAMIENITERKSFEQQREELLISLQEKTREIERFTSIIRHDLANPVISIQGFAEELVYTCKEVAELVKDQPLDESVKTEILTRLEKDAPFSISFIKDSVKQMNILLEGLRQVAAVGRVPVEIETLNMGELIKDFSITMTTQLKDADAVLTTGGLPDCKGDAAQVKQIFGNLITNALKYKHPDRRPRIHIDGKTEDGRCVYRVVDNGMGIESHNQMKVFDMFYRVDPDHPAQGDGIGLSIVAKILERHNGKIWLESEPGEGSTFFISLPH